MAEDWEIATRGWKMRQLEISNVFREREDACFREKIRYDNHVRKIKGSSFSAIISCFCLR